MRIAVASKSGIDIDQHFGHAERFLIYDFAGGSPRRVDEVAVEKYCSFDPDHPFRHRQFDAIVQALQGCRALLTVMIGELPRQELQKAGIEPLIAAGPIAPALQAAHRQLCGCGCKGAKKC